jgi:monooxygenase
MLLEGRDRSGGTWDVFRYPGVRSDSDMHTLGYRFKPWRADESIADGPAILEYIRSTAMEYGVDQKIRYRHRVIAASWSSETARWSLKVKTGNADQEIQITCNFIFMCAGYYSYRGGYSPDFPDRELFKGTVVHPQSWPEDLIYEGKRVAIIGSGATAVTLVPAMTQDAEHVTMVQRSPSYIVALPNKDRIANGLRWLLPAGVAYGITRWKNIALQRFIYRQTRIRPDWIRRRLLKMAQKAVGPDVPMEPHLTPKYAPWDQRLCVDPNGGFFEALRTGDATIVTGEIERFTEAGILMTSGEVVPADIIVTATGLKLVFLGEVDFVVDGQRVDFSQRLTYKGIGYSDVPNLCAAFGYINGSWTLRADLICDYVCRLLKHMDTEGTRQCTPRLRPEDVEMETQPFIDDFTPGYIERAQHLFPRQGSHDPWRNPQDYALDKERLGKATVDDGVMIFSKPSTAGE